VCSISGRATDNWNSPITTGRNPESNVHLCVSALFCRRGYTIHPEDRSLHSELTVKYAITCLREFFFFFATDSH